MLAKGLETFALGFGTVFVGLICLIFLVKAMSFLMGKFQPAKTEAPKAAPAPAQTDANMADRGAFVAAVAAAVAEVMGCDVTGLRIHSIKKI